MKNLVVKFAAVVVVSVIACVTHAAAQSTPELRFDFPFSFYVNDHKFDAGTYLIGKANSATNQPIMSIRRRDGKASRLLILQSTARPGRSPFEAAAVFNRYGSTYFLAEIRDPIRGFGIKALASKRELALARAGQTKVSETIASSVRK